MLSISGFLIFESLIPELDEELNHAR